MNHRSWIPICGVLLLVAVAAILAGRGSALAASDPVPWDEGSVALASAATVETAAGDLTVEPATHSQLASHDRHGWSWDNGWWVVMASMMVLFWGGIIALVIWGVRQFSGGSDQRPLDIAKERLAKGEINKEEFDRMRDDLA